MSPIIFLGLLIPLVAAKPSGSLLAGAPTKAPVIIHLETESITVEFLLGRNQSSLLPRNSYGSLWMKAEIGKPYKTYKLALNTAVERTFVAKVGFKQGTSKTVLYDPAKSQTSHWLNFPFFYRDGDVSVVGEMYQDNVVVNAMDLRVPFGVITELRNQSTLIGDGQLGLGWTPYYDDDDTEFPVPIIHTMLKDRPMNAYQLYSKPTHSAISIGDVGMYQCISHPTVWLQILKDARTPMVMVNSFEIGKYHYAAEHRALFDSSIHSIHMPKDPLLTLLRIYNAQFDTRLGVYLADCSNNKHEWKVTIEQEEFQILDKYALVDILLKDGRCALMIEQSKFVGTKQLFRFGLPFFHRYCIAFDVGKNRVGVAESTED